MKKEEKVVKNKSANNSSSGAVYGIGMLGALYYFLSNSTSFTEGILGILKSLVWPALVVYKFFEIFKF